MRFNSEGLVSGWCRFSFRASCRTSLWSDRYFSQLLWLKYFLRSLFAVKAFPEFLRQLWKSTNSFQNIFDVVLCKYLKVACWLWVCFTGKSTFLTCQSQKKSSKLLPDKYSTRQETRKLYRLKINIHVMLC